MPSAADAVTPRLPHGARVPRAPSLDEQATQYLAPVLAGGVSAAADVGILAAALAAREATACAAAGATGSSIANSTPPAAVALLNGTDATGTSLLEMAVEAPADNADGMWPLLAGRSPCELARCGGLAYSQQLSEGPGPSQQLSQGPACSQPEGWSSSQQLAGLSALRSGPASPHRAFEPKLLPPCQSSCECERGAFIASLQTHNWAAADPVSSDGAGGGSSTGGWAPEFIDDGVADAGGKHPTCEADEKTADEKTAEEAPMEEAPADENGEDENRVAGEPKQGRAVSLPGREGWAGGPQSQGVGCQMSPRKRARTGGPPPGGERRRAGGGCRRGGGVLGCGGNHVTAGGSVEEDSPPRGSIPSPPWLPRAEGGASPCTPPAVTASASGGNVDVASHHAPTAQGERSTLSQVARGAAAEGGSDVDMVAVPEEEVSARGAGDAAAGAAERAPLCLAEHCSQADGTAFEHGKPEEEEISTHPRSKTVASAALRTGGLVRAPRVSPRLVEAKATAHRSPGRERGRRA